MITTSVPILDRLRRTTEQIVGEEHLTNLLTSDRPMRIKYGVDCTSPHLHLGHAVNLWQMRALQDLGHRVIFLIGDLTTRIGDPTGKNQTRPTLSPEQIETNAQAFLEQAGLVLDTRPEVFEVRRNSEWFDAMGVDEMLSHLATVTHAQLISRDMFRDRIADGQEIAMHELIYPVLQGIDSAQIASDLTIVGTDQLFNEMMGRHFQSIAGQPPQSIITTTITPGLDGRQKQSKSLNNYIALTDSAEEKFGKLMSLSDELVGRYALVYSDLTLGDVEDISERAASATTAARDAKLDMAEAVVSRHHGASAAHQARGEFTRVFSERSEPTALTPLPLARSALTTLELVLTARPQLSRSDARRLITQGGVQVADSRVDDPHSVTTVQSGDVIKIGKRAWFRVAVEPCS